MAYQSPENAQKLRDIPQASYTATNNAPPMSQEVVQSLAGATPNTNLSPAEGGNNVPQASSASAQAEPGVNWNRIGRMMAGFGAGYQGRGAEYLNALGKQDAALDKSRQQAMLKDLTTVNGLLSKGLYMEAEKLAVDRVGAIEKFGGDTSHTRQLLDLLRNGEYDKAQAIVGNEMESAYTMGLIDRPASEATKITEMMIDGVEHRVVINSTGKVIKDLGRTKKSSSLKTLGTGDQLIDPITGKVVAENNNEDPARYNTLFKIYDNETKENKADTREVEKLIVALDAGGGASTETINSSLAALYGGNSRAIAELIRWQNLGNVPEKIENYLSRAIKGGYSELNIKEITDLTRAFSTHLNEEREKINTRHRGLGKRFKVTPDYISGGIDMSQLGENYMQMTRKQLLSVDPELLNSGALTAYSDALAILEGQ